MKKRKAPDGTAEPCSGVGGGDRLSCLPDELIGRILSFLPTPQAALTAQLSRRWRRAWAHVAALNLSVQDCVRSGKGPRFCALATAALARFPTPVIPAISVEVDHHIYLVDEWYGRAMARAVGSVRVTSLRGLNFLRLPPCTHAEALDMTAPRTTLTLPDPEPEADLVFGRLAELSLALLQLGGARPLDEFLASCCPRLRTLRLRRVRGHPVRRLALRTGTLEVLDLDTVDDLATLDVVAAKLRCLSVRSCFRLLPRDGDGDGDGRKVTVSAPRIEAICWYRSYPEQLTFRDGGLEHVRRLAGPLKLPTLGRRDQFDAPHTTQLLRSCALAVDRLDMELVVPDEMALLNWLGAPPAAEARATCEDLIRHVPALPCVRVLSLKIRWGFGGGVGPCLASFLSRTPSLTRLRIDASTYCLTVYEADEEAPPPPPRGKQLQWKRSDVVGADEQRVRLDGLREISVDGLKGTDSEEHRLVQLLLASAPPSLERMSLTFRHAAASIVDEIAAEIPVHFPMATGRWDRCTTSVLTWTRVGCMEWRVR